LAERDVTKGDPLTFSLIPNPVKLGEADRLVTLPLAVDFRPNSNGLGALLLLAVIGLGALFAGDEDIDSD
jgi:hypothetical protein